MKFRVNSVTIETTKINLVGSYGNGKSEIFPLWVHGIPKEYHKLVIEKLEGGTYDIPTWETFRFPLDTAAPTTYHILDFTPGEALFILSINRHQEEDDEESGNQRSLAFPQVMQWLRLLEQADFGLCPEGVVIIPENKSSNNAQHRCTGGALFGKPFPMTLSTGWTKAVLPTLDQGRPRSLGDLGTIAGGYAWRSDMGPQKTAIAVAKLIHDERFLDRQITPEALNDIFKLFGPSFRVVRAFAKDAAWLRSAGTMAPWVVAHRVSPEMVKAALRAITTASVTGPGGDRHPLRVIFKYVNHQNSGAGVNSDKKKKPSSSGNKAKGLGGSPAGNQIIFRKILYGLLKFETGQECGPLQAKDYIVPTYHGERSNILNPLYTHEQQSSLDLPAAPLTLSEE